MEPFRQVIKEHGAEALMTAYNEINGVPGMLNPEVQRILKDQWGLHHVVCDGADVSQTAKKWFGTQCVRHWKMARSRQMI